MHRRGCPPCAFAVPFITANRSTTNSVSSLGGLWALRPYSARIHTLRHTLGPAHLPSFSLHNPRRTITMMTSADQQASVPGTGRTSFRSMVKVDGSSPFLPATNRYRLFISVACPFSSPCFMTIKLKGLDDAIPISVLHPTLSPMGWRFVTEDEPNKPPMTSPDPLFGFKLMREYYLMADANYVGKFTVPMLWDTETNTIVNNESSELLPMLNSEFNSVAKHPDVDLYPIASRPSIDATMKLIAEGLTSPLYMCGGATVQQVYDEAFDKAFSTMEELEKRLGTSRYICGTQLSLADMRLFSTLIRFDPVYSCHFKANLHVLRDYPNISGYVRELYQMPAIRSTVDFEQIKAFYYTNTKINPSGIIPKGPDLSYLNEHHGRE